MCSRHGNEKYNIGSVYDRGQSPSRIVCYSIDACADAWKFELSGSQRLIAVRRVASNGRVLVLLFLIESNAFAKFYYISCVLNNWSYRDIVNIINLHRYFVRVQRVRRDSRRLVLDLFRSPSLRNAGCAVGTRRGMASREYTLFLNHRSNKYCIQSKIRHLKKFLICRVVRSSHSNRIINTAPSFFRLQVNNAKTVSNARKFV